jgi:hypothetical protein
MDNEWHTPKSHTRIALGVTFIIAAFVWMTYFGNYLLTTYKYSTPDRFVFWFGATISVSLLFVGFTIGFSMKIKQAVLGFLYLLGFLFTLQLIPVPEGYGEAVYGSYFLLYMLPMILYIRHEKSKKNKNQVL